MKKTKVVVGMSGGVDSSVCAFLLKQQGFDVIGITMQIWQDDRQFENSGCCGLSAVEDARRVAHTLDIPYYVLNFKDDFKKNVVDYFVQEYKEGKTPNPCIACNRYVKWESLLKKAVEIGADYIATGHYAKIERKNDRFVLKQSKTAQKDQTYALYNLTQYQLAHTLMPLGDYEKEEVRRIAKENGLNVYNKPDSQEICFIPDNDYGKFIESVTGRKSKQGNFIDSGGNILGKHAGIERYTIGQRKGLGIALGKPMYVKKIDVENNEITLCENEALFETKLIAEHTHIMLYDKLAGEEKAFAKIRYSHQGASCKMKMVSENEIECLFDEPQRAITPGQAVVFYQDGYVLGGGVIKK